MPAWVSAPRARSFYRWGSTRILTASPASAAPRGGSAGWRQCSGATCCCRPISASRCTTPPSTWRKPWACACAPPVVAATRLPWRQTPWTCTRRPAACKPLPGVARSPSLPKSRSASLACPASTHHRTLHRGGRGAGVVGHQVQPGRPAPRHCRGAHRPAGARGARSAGTALQGQSSRNPGTKTCCRPRRPWRWAWTSATCRRCCCVPSHPTRPASCSASAGPAAAMATP